MAAPIVITRPAAGDDILAGWGDNVADDINFLLNPPLFVGGTASAQSIPNAAFTDVAWDVNVTDTFGGHSTVTNNPRYVAQVAGYYEIVGSALFSSNTTGIREARLAVSGVVINDSTETANPVTASTATSVSSSYTVFLAVGAYVTMQVFQTSTVALPLATGFSKMSVLWVHA